NYLDPNQEALRAFLCKHIRLVFRLPLNAHLEGPKYSDKESPACCRGEATESLLADSKRASLSIAAYRPLACPGVIDQCSIAVWGSGGFDRLPLLGNLPHELFPSNQLLLNQELRQCVCLREA